MAVRNLNHLTGHDPGKAVRSSCNRGGVHAEQRPVSREAFIGRVLRKSLRIDVVERLFHPMLALERIDSEASSKISLNRLTTLELSKSAEREERRVERRAAISARMRGQCFGQCRASTYDRHRSHGSYVCQCNAAAQGGESGLPANYQQDDVSNSDVVWGDHQQRASNTRVGNRRARMKRGSRYEPQCCPSVCVTAGLGHRSNHSVQPPPASLLESIQAAECAS